MESPSNEIHFEAPVQSCWKWGSWTFTFCHVAKGLNRLKTARDASTVHSTSLARDPKSKLWEIQVLWIFLPFDVNFHFFVCKFVSEERIAKEERSPSLEGGRLVKAAGFELGSCKSTGFLEKTRWNQTISRENPSKITSFGQKARWNDGLRMDLTRKPDENRGFTSRFALQDRFHEQNSGKK